MNEFRVIPTVFGGFNAFKLERLANLWIFGSAWTHVAYCTSRKEAEDMITHLCGPIIRMTAQGKSGSESK